MQVAIKTAQVDQDSKERRLQYQYQQAIQSCKALVQVLEHKQCELEELQWLIEKQVYVKDDADEKKFNILMSKIDTSCMLEVESLLEQDEMLSQIPFLSPEQCKQKFTLEQLSEAIEKLKDLNGKLDTMISNAQRLVEFAKEANARFDNKQQKQKELDKKQQAKEKEEKKDKNEKNKKNKEQSVSIKPKKAPAPIVAPKPVQLVQARFFQPAPAHQVDNKRKIALTLVFESVRALAEVPQDLHYARLYHLVRIFENLKKYLQQNESPQVIVQAQITEIRNMLVHHGAAILDKDVVKASVDVLNLQLPSTLLMLQKPHQKECDLTVSQQEHCRALLGGRAPQLFDEQQVPMIGALRVFHQQFTDSSLDSHEVFEQVLSLQEKLRKCLAFIEYHPKLEQALLDEMTMMMTICGENYRLVKGIAPKEHQAFLSECLQVRNKVVHELRIPKAAVLLAYMKGILRPNMEEEQKSCGMGR